MASHSASGFRTIAEPNIPTDGDASEWMMDPEYWPVPYPDPLSGSEFDQDNSDRKLQVSDCRMEVARGTPVLAQAVSA
jgi:hypothetical protein